MANFLKNALEELDHVVWPTHAESRKYMIYTVGTIIIMAVLLAIAGYLLSGGLSAARTQFPHTPLPVASESEDLVTEADLEKLEKSAADKRNALSGAKVEVEGGSGLIITPTLPQ